MESLILILIILLLVLVVNMKNKLNFMEIKLSELKNLFEKNQASAQPNTSQKESIVTKEEIRRSIEQVREPEVIKKPEIIKEPEVIEQVVMAANKPAIMSVPKVSKPPKPSFLERNPDLEKFIGENLLSKIGIVIFVIGMGFLIKMGIDNGVIKEGMRVAIGVLIGGGMIGLAHYLRKTFVKFSSILIGGALSVLYFTIALAFHEYHIIPQAAAFVIMVFITAFAVLLSVSYDRVELAVLAIIGGFGTPFFISTGSGDVVTLFSYILILDIGMLLLVYFKKWNIINYLAFAFTYILFSVVFVSKFLDEQAVTEGELLVFLTSFYLIFFLMSIIYNVVNNRKFRLEEIGILLCNSGFYFGYGLYLVNQAGDGQYDGLFTGLIALLNFGFTYALFKRKDIDKNLVYLLIGLVLTFLTIMAPVQLQGNFITLFWALESVLLLWLSIKSEIKLMKLASVIITLLMVISLAIDWKESYVLYGMEMTLDLLLNKVFITSIVSMGSLFAISQLTKEDETFHFGGLSLVWRPLYVKILFILILYGGFFSELNYQFSRYEFDYSNQIILLGIFNYVFVILLGVLPYFQSSNLIRKATGALAVIAVLSYMTGYLNQIAIARDNQLTSVESGSTGFFAHYLLLALFIVIVYGIYRQIHSQYGFKSVVGTYALWALALIVVFVSSVEVGHLSVMYTYAANNSIDYSSAVKNVYPIVWAITALALMILGMKFRLKTLRLASLGLFLITILKLFFYDLAGNSTGKIVSFILLGVILLLISFLYQKLKFIIQDDEKTD